MNKAQFMAELKQFLGDIPAAERDEALEYYEDYFDEAGEENEQTILKELESPEKIAFMIKAGLKDTNKSIGEFTENGFKGYEPYSKEEVANRFPDSDDRGFTHSNPVKEHSTLLLIILFICLLPVIAPIFFSILGIAIGIICSIFGICIGCIFGGLGLIIAGVFFISLGIPGFFSLPFGSLIVAGGGLASIGIGILLLCIGIKIVGVGLPWFFSKMSYLIKKLIAYISTLRIRRATI